MSCILYRVDIQLRLLCLNGSPRCTCVYDGRMEKGPRHGLWWAHHCRYFKCGNNQVPHGVVAVGLERKRWNSRNIGKAELTCPSAWVDLGILLEGAVLTLSEISVEPSHWDSINPSMPSICSSEQQNQDDLGGSSFVFCGWCLAPKWLDYLWDIMFLHDDHVGLTLLRTSSVD